MTTKNELTPLESVILRKVIDLYITTGSPVSSRTVRDIYKLDSSTANIRKVLHSLEEKGYLFKPHVSAGRIPSDMGYRKYVDGIRIAQPLGRKVAEDVMHRMGQEWGDVRDVMSRTSRLISGITRCMGLIMGVMHSYGNVSRLRIVQLEGTGALVILSMSAGMERKIYVEFPKRYMPHVMDRAAQIINERISGYPVEQAHQRLEFLLKECDGMEREITEVLSSEAEELFDTPYRLEYHFDAFSRDEEVSDLRNPRLLQNLVRIMGEKSLMLGVLKERMHEDIVITIGKENQENELEEFSLITRKFSTSDYDGVFGVLGPTRMSYDLVLSLLTMLGAEFQSR
ncbi:MAG: heat-inducible transcriptional repressor HrcA [Candidatus Dadabacteria bacterium]|nr:heat-inducible transcriptional repressor HrcA [Candidatus Dadabacteria bacterium]